MLALLKDVFVAVRTSPETLELTERDIGELAILLSWVVDAAKTPGLETAVGQVMTAFQNAGFLFRGNGSRVDAQLLRWKSISG